MASFPAPVFLSLIVRRPCRMGLTAALRQSAAPWCVNIASWPLRQILPANRRLVSVSSTQLPREKELRAQARTLFCGGCTKTRRLQDVFSRPGRRHRASSYARALLLLAAFVSACGVHEFSHWGSPPTLEYMVHSDPARPKEQRNVRTGGRRGKGGILSSADTLILERTPGNKNNWGD